MKKRTKLILLILLFMAVGVISFTATYAWFTAATNSDSLNFARTGKIEVQYIKGDDINGSLIPALNKDNGLNTTVSVSRTNESINANLTLSIIIDALPPALKITALNWELYKNDGLVAVATGNFAYTDEGQTLDLYQDVLETTSNSYTLYIWLDGRQVGNEVANLTFSGRLVASAQQTNAT